MQWMEDPWGNTTWSWVSWEVLRVSSHIVPHALLGSLCGPCRTTESTLWTNSHLRQRSCSSSLLSRGLGSMNGTLNLGQLTLRLPRDSGLVMCPNFQPLTFGIRWWTCKCCPWRRQIQPLCWCAPFALCTFMWNAPRALMLWPPLCLICRSAEGKDCLQTEVGLLASGCYRLGAPDIRQAVPPGARGHSTLSVACSWSLVCGSFL